MGLLSSILGVVGGALGGPFGGLAGDVVGSLFGGDSGSPSQQATGARSAANTGSMSPAQLLSQQALLDSGLYVPSPNSGVINSINLGAAERGEVPMAGIGQMANQQGGLANGAQFGNAFGGAPGVSNANLGAGALQAAAGAGNGGGMVSPAGVRSPSPTGATVAPQGVSGGAGNNVMPQGWVPASMKGILSYSNGQYHSYAPQIGVGNPNTTGGWNALGIGYVPPEVTNAWNAEQKSKSGLMSPQSVQTVSPQSANSFWPSGQTQAAATTTTPATSTQTTTNQLATQLMNAINASSLQGLSAADQQTLGSLYANTLQKYLSGEGGLPADILQQQKAQGMGDVYAAYNNAKGQLADELASRGLSQSGIAANQYGALSNAAAGQAGQTMAGINAQNVAAARTAQQYGMGQYLSEQQLASEAANRALSGDMSMLQYLLNSQVAANNQSNIPSQTMQAIEAALGPIAQLVTGTGSTPTNYVNPANNYYSYNDVSPYTEPYQDDWSYLFNQ